MTQYYDYADETIASLPKPERLVIQGESKPERRRAPIRTRAPRRRVLKRAILWGFNLLRFAFRFLSDRIRGHKAPNFWGARLRELFEDMGGTAIKIGQQLSVRIDILPLQVCHELAKLRDKVPPIPFDEAVVIIEAAASARAGKKMTLKDIFATFDPNPIGSASIACVYQAVLHSGERVAVKVRRPSVEATFGEDLGVLDWATELLELFSVFRKGFFRNLRVEVRSMLSEELDFASEARFQRLFRYYTKKDRLSKWLTAPIVYDKYCSQDVMVSEFVEGVWCDELLKAYEVDDRKVLGELEKRGITPKKVGKRLMYYSFWCRFEAIFFHADPHPGNILIQDGSKIVFVDFGSCGTTSRKSRMAQMMMIERMSYNDVPGTVDAAVTTLEPLPYVDIFTLKKEVEQEFWKWLFAFRDKKAEWWERTTAGIWWALLEITRKSHIPIALETLRLARSLLLIDTLCFELDPQMVSPTEFHRYMKMAARRSARRVYKRALDARISSQVDMFIAETTGVTSRARYFAWQAERAIERIPNEFALGIKKSAYFVLLMMRIGIVTVTLGLISYIGILLFIPDPWSTLSGWWDQLLAEYPRVLPIAFSILGLSIVWALYRKVMFRLSDLDVDDYLIR